MAIDQEALTRLEELMTPPAKATGEFNPFPWKGPSPDQKALIRPLLNMLDYVTVLKHEYYDNASKTWKVRNYCPGPDSGGLECQVCLDVEAMPETTKEEKSAKRKSRATKRLVLPIYLHAVVDMKTGLSVTYKNADDEEVPVSGPRLLEMKPEYSTILHDLVKAYQHPMGGNDITKYDFKIVCTTGSDGFPKYDVTPQAPSAFTKEVPPEYLDKAELLNLYWNACPPKLVGDKPEPAVATPAKPNGKVKNAPDF